jgi:hypothetical protein
MENHENECVTPTLGDDIAFICETDDSQAVADYFDSGEPPYLDNLRYHPEYCSYCFDRYPSAAEHIEAVQNILRGRALRELESLHERFAAEFSVHTSNENINWIFADRIAALASTYAAPALWQLYVLRPDSYWKEFAVLPGLAGSDALVDLHELAEHFQRIPHDALHFLFKLLTARQLYRDLYRRLDRMLLPNVYKSKPEGIGFEVLDNPDYPIYQAYEVKVSESAKEADECESRAPLYGSTMGLNFIREMIRERLLETPVDYQLFYFSIDVAAERYLKDLLEQDGDSSARSTGSISAAHVSAGNRKLNEIHQDLADATDSIKAGQMEILHALQNRRRAAEFLPLVESRLGAVYTRLHHETQRLLALGEYFLAINQAEPDTMNSVVLHQAKACENELYMRIFGPYLSKLFSEGARDYPADGSSSVPLIKSGKEQPRSMTLGSYCWYLRKDLLLRSWIESALQLHLPTLTNEASWISAQRNLAAHEADFKQYNAATFQSRVYNPQGLLVSLHSKG